MTHISKQTTAATTPTTIPCCSGNEAGPSRGPRAAAARRARSTERHRPRAPCCSSRTFSFFDGAIQCASTANSRREADHQQHPEGDRRNGTANAGQHDRAPLQPRESSSCRRRARIFVHRRHVLCARMSTRVVSRALSAFYKITAYYRPGQDCSGHRGLSIRRAGDRWSLPRASLPGKPIHEVTRRSINRLRCLDSVRCR